jgi:hypothetical protein
MPIRACNSFACAEKFTMHQLRESQTEINKLRIELTRRLDELQRFVAISFPEPDLRVTPPPEATPLKFIPPVIPNIGRQRVSRIVISTGSQTDKPNSLVLRRDSPASSIDLSLSRERLGLPVKQPSIDATSVQHHRERLATCISEIRNRLSRIHDPPSHSSLIRSASRSKTPTDNKRYLS